MIFVMSVHKTILLIGPVDKANRFVGGATVSFRDFQSFLVEQAIPHGLINTRKYNRVANPIANLVHTLFWALVQTPRYDVVMLHASHKGVLYLGPILFMIASVFGKRFSLRPFGGDLWDLYEAAPSWHRTLLRRTVFRSQPLFVETNVLLDRVRSLAPNAAWFPNCRRKAAREARAYGLCYSRLMKFSRVKNNCLAAPEVILFA